MAITFKHTLEELLKTDMRLIDETGELRGNLIRELANQLDEQLLELLLNHEAAREKFFVKVKDVHVFHHNDFKFFLDENKLDNSYTQYENKIGLSVGGKLLRENHDVVLNFPYKDCVLEGGQSTEEGMDTYFEQADGNYVEKQSKRKEIFFNEVLARDEIDRLYDPKAFTNITKYSTNGTEKPTGFTRNAEGTITDNLLIKGNNLLALHSLKQEFKGKVKLIYIDPPYNTGNDGFKYNDNFNHSTWLAFMRNRLEVAKDLLSNDGAIFIQCDHHQLGYLNVLMDDKDLFRKENKVQVIAIKTASPAGFKTVNPGPIDVTEYILFYTKNKSRFEFSKHYVPVGYNANYNLYLERSENLENWRFSPIKDKVIESAGFANESEAKKKYGDLWKSILKSLTKDFAYHNAENVVSIRDPHKPTDKLKALMTQSKNENRVISYTREDGSVMYLYKGGALAFYSNKMQELDGKMEITELLTDFWNHISWAGIANEGGVKLKNGKKPEKLLKQIIDIATKKGDLILDFHLGSGTTAAVAHKMGRQFIGIEQLDYGTNDSVKRLQNVINGDSTGISKAVNWQGGGSFIYLELAKNNEQAKEQIMACNSLEELMQLFEELYHKFFLHYNVRAKEFRDKISKEEAFIALPLSRQQEIFCRMLDLNQLYVNASEMEDSRYNLPAEDIALTKAFYQIAE